MIINVDEEGGKAIQGLCDIALKVAGLKNLQGVTNVLSSVKPIPPVPQEKPDPELNKGGGINERDTPHTR